MNHEQFIPLGSYALAAPRDLAAIALEGEAQLLAQTSFHVIVTGATKVVLLKKGLKKSLKKKALRAGLFCARTCGPVLFLGFEFEQSTSKSKS